MAPPLLFTNRGPKGQTDSDDGCGDTHDGSKGLNPLTLVGNHVALRKASHDLGGRGRNSVSDLVSDTRKSGTELRWGKLVEVNGDDAPSALDHELEEEGTDGQTGLGVWQNPAGDQSGGAEASGDDGASAADGLRDVTDDGSADGRSDLGVDGTTGGISL